MKNVDLRNYARARNVRFWQVAQAIGVSEATMTRHLRNELPMEEKTKIARVIDKIASKSP